MTPPQKSPRGSVLITSGAYAGSELAAEFGRLPPAFLPVGNQRLISHQQAQLAEHFSRIFLSLPEDFEVEHHDQVKLEKLGVRLVFVPPALDLPSSILYAIAQSEIDDGPLAILHGDTLFFDIDYEVKDSVSVAEAGDLYDWAACEIDDGKVVAVGDSDAAQSRQNEVLSGFFHFSSTKLLIRCLAGSRGKFVAAMDRYVRERPMTALRSNRWLDFGHLQRFHTSRGLITTERVFNSLNMSARSVVKTSEKVERVEAESGWYEAVPPPLRIYLPQYLGRRDTDERAGYALEFLYMAPLSDLFVFGALPKEVWRRIFSSCADFLAEAASFRAPYPLTSVMDMYLPKTLARLEEFGRTSGIDLDRAWTCNGVKAPSLRDIAHIAAAAIPEPSPEHLSVVHGDSCFSNILYDFRSQSVRLIDPRGQDAAGAPTIWGDNRYDLAKLYHSAHGLYDMIVAGYHDTAMPSPHVLEIVLPRRRAIEEAQAAFDEVFLSRAADDIRGIKAINVHLFLSMLPLHSDSPPRQIALLANALRMFQALRDEGGQQ